MKRRQFASGGFRVDAMWSVAGSILPILLGAASLPLLLRGLGPSAFAIYALSIAVHSFAPSLDLGVARTSFRRMALLRQSTEVERRGMSAACLKRGFWVGLGGAIVAALLIQMMGRDDGVGKMLGGSINALYVAALGIPPAIFGNVQRAVLEGSGAFSASAGSRIVLGALTAILPVVILIWSTDVVVLSAAQVVLRVVGNFMQHRALVWTSLWTPGSGRTSYSSGEGNTGFWRESCWYGVLAPISLLMCGFDRFVIAWIANPGAQNMAVFLAPQEIMLKAIVFSAALVPAFVVRLAPVDVDVNTSRALATRLLRYVGVVVFASCALASVLISEVAPFIFAGLNSQEVGTITQILLIGVYANAMAQIPSAMLMARGMVKCATLIQAVQLPIYLMSIGPLVREFGVAGAAWAWSGRIALDGIMLAIATRTLLPTLSVRGWWFWNLAGVTSLVLIQRAV